MKKVSGLLALALILGLSSCSKDDENTQGGYTIRIGDGLNKKANSLQVTKALAYLEEVELEREVGDDDEEEIDIEGRFTVDLLTGNSNPPIPTVEITPGNYHELELEFGDEDRMALDIAGTYTDTSGTSFGFTLSLISELEFEIEAEGNGLVITEDDFTTLNVRFPVTQALQSLNWASASVDANNNITINQQTNASLLNSFLSALQLEVDD